MRNKMFLMVTTVLASLFICSYTGAAVRFDPDVGWNKSIVKLTNFNTDGIQLVAYIEAAPALVRLAYVDIAYQEPKSESNILVWNARIEFNYCFQLPGNGIRADPNRNNNTLSS